MYVLCKMITRNRILTISTTFLMLLLCNSCFVFKDNAKYAFTDGLYQQKILGKSKVYVLHVDEDTLAVIPVSKIGDSVVFEPKKRINYTPTLRRMKGKKMDNAFYKPSFDVDIITIPLKYRPSQNDLPNQLITSFNGALYCGYRIDEYRIEYKKTPLHTYKQYSRHLGYSGGWFVGIGSSTINQQFINIDNFEYEYEGVNLVTGACVNMATDGLTFGVCVGFDHLLDKYHKSWVYQKQPWVGLSLGLDLY